MTLSKGQTLAVEGMPVDYAYAVVRGGVKMQTSLADGRMVIVDFRLPGEFLILTEGLSPWTIEAIDESSLCHIRESTLTAVLRDGIPLNARASDALTSELRSASARIARLALMTPVEKVSSFLLDMRARLASPDQGRTLDLPMRREEIGQHLGLTPETVSRMLTRLTGDGTIAIPRPSRIRLLDLARLRCLAEGGSPRRCAATRAARGAGAA